MVEVGSSPVVSVITPTYNSAKYLVTTYESLRSQTLEDWEWVITDDCSNDGTVAIIADLAANDSRIRLYKNELNCGAAVSRNNSIRHAVGRYIAFLDSDDLWTHEKLATQISFMQLYSSEMSFTSYRVIDSSGGLKDKIVDARGPGLVRYHDLLAKKVTFGCSTVMIDTFKVAPFSMPLIRTGQDYVTWLLLLKRGCVAHRLSDPLTHYRITPNSISRNKLRKAHRQWRIYRDLEKLTFFPALFYFSSYAFRAVFRN